MSLGRLLQQDWQDKAMHRRVWAMAAPMILSNLTVPLVTLTDTAVVGRLPHAYQLGAVVLASTLYVAMIGSLGFLRMGTTGFAAQAAGRNDADALHRILWQGLLLGAGLAALLIALSIPATNALLGLIDPTPELRHDAQQFFQTRLLGLPAALASYALIGWFLGNQNARMPLLMLVVTGLSNIALVLTFVLHWQWGIKGAALASVIAEWLGFIVGLSVALRQLKSIGGKLHWPSFILWRNWKPLLSVNRDIFLRSLALQSVFLFFASQGARMGDDIIAANAILLNGLMLTAYALDGLAQATEALCGHAIGARSREQLRRALVITGGWSFLVSVAFLLGFSATGSYFIDLQTSLVDVRNTALRYLPYLAVLPVIAVWSYLLDGLFIGATRAREMRDAMLLALLLSAPITALLLPLGNDGLWLSFISFLLLRGLLMAWFAWRIKQRQQWLETDAR